MEKSDSLCREAIMRSHGESRGWPDATYRLEDLDWIDRYGVCQEMAVTQFGSRDVPWSEYMTFCRQLDKFINQHKWRKYGCNN